MTRWRLPLAAALALGLGGLTAVSVGSTLLVGLLGAQENTRVLLGHRANLILGSIEAQLRDHLDPVVAQGAGLRDLVAEGHLDSGDDEALAAAFRAAMAATPQVSGIAFIDAKARFLGVNRDRQTLIEDWSDSPRAIEALEEARRRREPHWRPPVWLDALQQPIFSLNVPVFGPEGFRGVITSAVTIVALSRIVGEIGAVGGQRAFVLYGEDLVLAHPELPAIVDKLSPERPLPSLAELGDPVLARIWDPKRNPLTWLGEIDGTRHMITLTDDSYVFVTRGLAGYGDRVWRVGTYLPGREAGAEVRRLWGVAIVGGALLVIAVLVAAWLGRRMSRPVVALSDAARAVRILDLDHVRRLPESRFRELDEAARAFNAMVAALRWFALYLPRSVVGRLISEDRAEVASEEREVTIMFADVVGFSRLAARLSPQETAAFLNRCFATLGSAIEAEDGTIDKYIGDGVMAFWGAPGHQPDHPARACRAALAAGRAMAVQNAESRARGEPVVGIRIGLHTGRAIVGNIGSPGRINYTIIGDAVNVAQRLEEAGRELAQQGETIVLLSEETRLAADTSSPIVPVGRRTLRGRSGEIVVYRLAIDVALAEETR